GGDVTRPRLAGIIMERTYQRPLVMASTFPGKPAEVGPTGKGGSDAEPARGRAGENGPPRGPVSAASAGRARPAAFPGLFPLGRPARRVELALALRLPRPPPLPAPGE